MSEEGPPKKKQKTCKSEDESENEIIDESETLPEYEFNENNNLTQGDAIEFDMNNMRVGKNTESLYTFECSSCRALIMVAEMVNGEIWHGMNHIRDDMGINDGFYDLMNKFEELPDSTIKNRCTYLTVIPELEDKNKIDVLKSDFTKTQVLCVDKDVMQLGLRGDKKYLKDLMAHISVKLSNGLIEVRYYAE